MPKKHEDVKTVRFPVSSLGFLVDGSVHIPT
jgi:hypothetical protein